MFNLLVPNLMLNTDQPQNTPSNSSKKQSLESPAYSEFKAGKDVFRQFHQAQVNGRDCSEAIQALLHISSVHLRLGFFVEAQAASKK